MQQGPFDFSNVKCYEKTGCCPVSPCDISLDDFICSVRALLPPGEVFNTTAPRTSASVTQAPGVGCFTVGCAPVCGESIDDPACDDEPPAPQIGMVDAFAATAYTAVEALCCMLKELDPCTAQTTVERWLARYGVPPSACAPTWSDETKALLLCLLAKVSHNFVLNKRNLDALAAYFGTTVSIFDAGDLNCGGLPGLFTFYRRLGQCTPRSTLPCVEGDASEIIVNMRAKNFRVQFDSACKPPPPIDLVVCQQETHVETNCLLPGAGYTVTPTQELYDAFLWLLDRLVSSGVNICVYRCEDVPCLENA